MPIDFSLHRELPKISSEIDLYQKLQFLTHYLVDSALAKKTISYEEKTRNLDEIIKAYQTAYDYVMGKDYQRSSTLEWEEMMYILSLLIKQEKLPEKFLSFAVANQGKPTLEQLLELLIALTQEYEKQMTQYLSLPCLPEQVKEDTQLTQENCKTLYHALISLKKAWEEKSLTWFAKWHLLSFEPSKWDMSVKNPWGLQIATFLFPTLSMLSHSLDALACPQNQGYYKTITNAAKPEKCGEYLKLAHEIKENIDNYSGTLHEKLKNIPINDPLSELHLETLAQTRAALANIFCSLRPVGEEKTVYEIYMEKISAIYETILSTIETLAKSEQLSHKQKEAQLCEKVEKYVSLLPLEYNQTLQAMFKSKEIIPFFYVESHVASENSGQPTKGYQKLKNMLQAHEAYLESSMALFKITFETKAPAKITPN